MLKHRKRKEQTIAYLKAAKSYKTTRDFVFWLVFIGNNRIAGCELIKNVRNRYENFLFGVIAQILDAHLYAVSVDKKPNLQFFQSMQIVLRLFASTFASFECTKISMHCHAALFFISFGRI